MKLTTANTVRTRLIAELMEHYIGKGEDCGMIATNSFTFPIAEDGEEGWIEIVVKIPKDDGDDGYAKREAYTLKVDERNAKAAAAAEKKAKKIAADAKKRAAKEGK